MKQRTLAAIVLLTALTALAPPAQASHIALQGTFHCHADGCLSGTTLGYDGYVRSAKPEFEYDVEFCNAEGCRGKATYTRWAGDDGHLVAKAVIPTDFQAGGDARFTFRFRSVDDTSGDWHQTFTETKYIAPSDASPSSNDRPFTMPMPADWADEGRAAVGYTVLAYEGAREHLKHDRLVQVGLAVGIVAVAGVSVVLVLHRGNGAPAKGKRKR